MRPRYGAVLFDLDGTLIGLDVEEFIPAYFESISRFVADDDSKRDEFIRRLTEATHHMIADTDPTVTNREVFERHFFDGVGKTRRAEEEAAFDEFYRREFPRLGSLCRPIPGVGGVLDGLAEAGVDRVLATNPLFPRMAIESRLQWGGLDPEGFALLTSYENSCFCKPNPGYYREILRKMGLEGGDVLMVGNDPLEDMIAAEAGVDTFLVDHYVVPRDGDVPNPTYRGSITDVPDVVMDS